MSTTARVQVVATVAGLVLAGALVWRTSSAAFTGTTDNTGNSFTAGTVVLTDDDSGAALFTATAWVPGDTATQCIEVTYTGTGALGAPISFYAAYTDSPDGTTADELSDDLDVLVELGDAAATCAAFTGSALVATTPLASMPSSGSPQSTGWTPTASVDAMRAFRITVTLGADTANDAQGDSSTAAFTWAATS